MTTAAYGYLLLPVVLFALGWLKWPLAIVVVVLAITAGVQCVRQSQGAEFEGFVGALQGKTFFFGGMILLVMVWVGISGIGGFAFQNGDYDMRNLMLRDLIEMDWPVIYDYTYTRADGSEAVFHGALVYYLAYWLPAAMVGKLAGWQAANVALYGWTVIGVTLALYQLLKQLQAFSRLAVFLFVFWSGMDAAGVLMLEGKIPLDGRHLEWWARSIQYSSVTTTLFWVFNQTVTTWLVVLLIFNQRNVRSLLFTYTLCLPYAPYPFIGLLPFVLYRLLQSPSLQQGELLRAGMRKSLREGLNGVSIAGTAAVGLSFGLYFLSNPQNTGKSGLVLTTGNTDWQVFGIIYCFFCLFEFALYALVIENKFRKNPYFGIAVMSLFLIPWYVGGINNDFVMRVSIPPLLVLLLFAIRYLLEEGTEWRKYVLVGMLVIGAVTPVNEMIRVVHNTLILPPERWVYDPYKSFRIPANAERSKFFVTQQPERAFFFHYLAQNR